jgi:hypothetical protein
MLDWSPNQSLDQPLTAVLKDEGGIMKEEAKTKLRSTGVSG